jgi:anti-sigma factor RsiW
MSCNTSAQIQAFYDGELPADAAASVEAHLRECAECAALLADLRSMSNLLATVPLTEMRSGAANRMYGAWRATSDRGVLRIASWLTAAAAVVLAGTVLTWPGQQNIQTARGPDALETLATVAPAEGHEDGRSEVVVLAQWIADDLSPNEQGMR